MDSSRQERKKGRPMDANPEPIPAAPAVPPQAPHNNINLDRTAYGFEYVRLHRTQLNKATNDQYFVSAVPTPRSDRAGLKPPALRLLRRFASVAHQNAEWYNWRVTRERWIQALYFLISIALMFAVPILIFKAPDFFGNAPTVDQTGKPDAPFPENSKTFKSAADIAGMVTAVLTGLLAVHRSISGWLGQRKLIGPYWQARSKLLDQIYTLETQWGGFDIKKKVQADGALTPEFRAAVISGIRTSRGIVREENDKFFENYQFRDVDIAAGIKAQMGTAKELAKAFESPSLTAAQTAEQAEQTRRAAAAASSAEVKALDAIIAEMETDREALEERLSKIQNSDLKPELVAELKALNTEIRKLKSQKVTAEITLRKNQISL